MEWFHSNLNWYGVNQLIYFGLSIIFASQKCFLDGWGFKEGASMGATKDWNKPFQLGLEWTISVGIGMDHSNRDWNGPFQ